MQTSVTSGVDTIDEVMRRRAAAKNAAVTSAADEALASLRSVVVKYAPAKDKIVLGDGSVSSSDLAQSTPVAGERISLSRSGSAASMASTVSDASSVGFDEAGLVNPKEEFFKIIDDRIKPAATSVAALPRGAKLQQYVRGLYDDHVALIENLKDFRLVTLQQIESEIEEIKGLTVQSGKEKEIADLANSLRNNVATFKAIPAPEDLEVERQRIGLMIASQDLVFSPTSLQYMDLAEKTVDALKRNFALAVNFANEQTVGEGVVAPVLEATSAEFIAENQRSFDEDFIAASAEVQKQMEAEVAMRKRELAVAVKEETTATQLAVVELRSRNVELQQYQAGEKSAMEKEEGLRSKLVKRGIAIGDGLEGRKEVLQKINDNIADVAGKLKSLSQDFSELRVIDDKVKKINTPSFGFLGAMWRAVQKATNSAAHQQRQKELENLAADRSNIVGKFVGIDVSKGEEFVRSELTTKNEKLIGDRDVAEKLIKATEEKEAAIVKRKESEVFRDQAQVELDQAKSTLSRAQEALRESEEKVSLLQEGLQVARSHVDEPAVAGVEVVVEGDAAVAEVDVVGEMATKVEGFLASPRVTEALSVRAEFEKKAAVFQNAVSSSFDEGVQVKRLVASGNAAARATKTQRGADVVNMAADLVPVPLVPLAIKAFGTAVKKFDQRAHAVRDKKFLDLVDKIDSKGESEGFKELIRITAQKTFEMLSGGMRAGSAIGIRNEEQVAAVANRFFVIAMEAMEKGQVVFDPAVDTLDSFSDKLASAVVRSEESTIGAVGVTRVLAENATQGKESITNESGLTLTDVGALKRAALMLPDGTVYVRSRQPDLKNGFRGLNPEEAKAYELARATGAEFVMAGFEKYKSCKERVTEAVELIRPGLSTARSGDLEKESEKILDLARDYAEKKSRYNKSDSDRDMSQYLTNEISHKYNWLSSDSADQLKQKIVSVAEAYAIEENLTRTSSRASLLLDVAKKFVPTVVSQVAGSSVLSAAFGADLAGYVQESAAESDRANKLNQGVKTRLLGAKEPGEVAVGLKGDIEANIREFVSEQLKLSPKNSIFRLQPEHEGKSHEEVVDMITSSLSGFVTAHQREIATGNEEKVGVMRRLMQDDESVTAKKDMKKALESYQMIDDGSGLIDKGTKSFSDRDIKRLQFNNVLLPLLEGLHRVVLTTSVVRLDPNYVDPYSAQFAEKKATEEKAAQDAKRLAPAASTVEAHDPYAVVQQAAPQVTPGFNAYGERISAAVESVVSSMAGGVASGVVIGSKVNLKSAVEAVPSANLLPGKTADNLNEAIDNLVARAVAELKSGKTDKEVRDGAAKDLLRPVMDIGVRGMFKGSGDAKRLTFDNVAASAIAVANEVVKNEREGKVVDRKDYSLARSGVAAPTPSTDVGQPVTVTSPSLEGQKVAGARSQAVLEKRASEREALARGGSSGAINSI